MDQPDKIATLGQKLEASVSYLWPLASLRERELRR